MDGMSFDEALQFLEIHGWGDNDSVQRRNMKQSGRGFRYYLSTARIGRPETCPPDAEFLGWGGVWKPCITAPTNWGGCIRRWPVKIETPLPSLEES